MSCDGKKYPWQEVEVSPHNVSGILDQMEFLEKMLDCDPDGLVIDFEEKMAIHEELSRLCALIPTAFDEEMRQRAETYTKVLPQHTGSSQQQQIYQEIESVEAELADCPRGSPQWFELHDRLSALLHAYVAVPRDPQPVRSDRWKNRWKEFHEHSHELCLHLWILFIAFLIGLPMALDIFQGEPWSFSMWLICLLVLFVWAVFATSSPKE